MKSRAMKPFEKAAILFLLKHLASGVAGAVVLATGLLILDVANLATLMGNSDHGIIAAIMLYASLILTFGSVAMGIGIMTLNEDTRP
ncbi:MULTISPECIES: hypothetical protein [Azospirillum]|uniref:Uncharacterized protein n=4 Tax=Azospirillum TaxID=191 RepID=A0A560BA81_9PROT|nr:MULTISPECIES: hypothetical protein [Azospirillum]KAA1056472.1 hypothetical protein FH063_004620 [Azospirillum argentinense]TWA69389.1 hypothetical protein FBZ84_103102 [Azospirillum baldaniorum]TWA78799.1 hypothetical protein FBZ85_105103 [Azospirillum brasilense]